MKGKCLYLLSALLFAACNISSNKVGDMVVCQPEIWQESQHTSFSPTAWNTADAHGRGQMVRDLAGKHRLSGVAPKSIRTLLGENTCYVNYDDEPCYALEIGGRSHFLAFPVAHSGSKQGEVVGVYLRSDPSALAGCAYEE